MKKPYNMKKAKQAEIKIIARFGSKFQEQFARDSLMANLKAWKQFLAVQHKDNDILIEINGQNIKHLDWFDFEVEKN